MDKWRFYVREAIHQLEYAKHSYAEFKKAELLNDTFSVFYNIHHFIIHITNVDKIFELNVGTKDWNKYREGVLKGKVDLAGFDLKQIRRLRNHLEHFDGRLDTWIKNHDGHAFFDNNIITGAKGFPEKAFLRALDGDVFKFYGEAFPLAPVFEIVEKLHAYLIDIEDER